MLILLFFKLSAAGTTWDRKLNLLQIAKSCTFMHLYGSVIVLDIFYPKNRKVCTIPARFSQPDCLEIFNINPVFLRGQAARINLPISYVSVPELLTYLGKISQ